MDIVLYFIYGPDFKQKAALDQEDPIDGVDLTNIWTYGAIIIVILTSLAWVRNIAKFRFTFIFANILLLSMMTIISIYSIAKLSRDGLGSGLVPVNTSSMWSMVGFSIYTFEGIGILMPCMQACECPEKFNSIQIAAVATVTGTFVVYGTLAYLAYGNMEEQMVTQILPQGDIIVKVLVVLIIIILILSYPLTVNPANTIFEHYTVDKWFPRTPKEHISIRHHDVNYQLRKWTKNLSRFFICISAAYLGIELSNVLDKFLGLMGALFCAPLALMTPAICHLKIMAKTKNEKIEDLAIVFISLLAVVLCVVTTLEGEGGA